MRQELKVIAAVLAAYAIFLPAALWIGSRYVLDPKPAGVMVEPLLKIVPYGDTYQSQSFVLWKHAGENTVVLYEDLTPIGPVNFVKIAEKFGDNSSSNLFIFSASDNSDPRRNGRNYWLVLPAE